jgi:serine/threonine-protein kinase
MDDTDVVLGTPAYMSPELLRAQGQPNERSDLFSLAAILYYALTGAAPYGSPGAGAQAHPLPPSAASIRQTVPPALDAAIQRALAPLRSDRQANVDEFLRQLPPS